MTEQMKVPKLRFEEFDAQWQLEPLSSYLMEHKEKTSAKTEMPVYTSSRTGLYPQSSYFDNRELQNDGEYGVVPVGFFVYRHMSDDSTFKFNINKVGNKIAVSKEYPVFTTNKMDSGFLLDYLNHGQQFKAFAVMQKQGGTRTRLYFKKLVTLKLPTPPLPEQQKIASFLSKVDEKISLLLAKKDKLTKYKRGVMQQLFNGKWQTGDDGQLTFTPPTLRFKADDGSEFPDWEEKKLGEVATFSKGKGISKAEITEGGQVPCVRYGELYTTYSEVIDTVYSRTDLPKDELILSRENDVIIPSSGETALDIATASCVVQSGVALSGDLTIIRSKLDGVFLSYQLNTAKKLELASIAQGSSVIHLYSTHLKDVTISIPDIQEQKKITSFLSAVEKKINLTNSELDKAREWKKGLLQQMFV